jgi:hypothetical protein
MHTMQREPMDLLVHSVQRNKVLLEHNAQSARLWAGTPTHILIHVKGGNVKWNSPPIAPNLAIDRSG